MTNAAVWNGDLRRADGRYYLAHSPSPAPFWTDHVWCSMAYIEEGETKTEDVRLTADEWFAMGDEGNILTDVVMTKPAAQKST